MSDKSSRKRGGGCCACPPPPNSQAPGRPCPPVSSIVALNADDPCSPEMCKIFGGHDAPYHPPFNPAMCAGMKKGKKRECDSLGAPVGTVILMQPQKSGQSNQESIRFATYLKSFAISYITARNDWNPDLLDQLMREGQTLFQDSQNMDTPNYKVREDVYSEAEQKVTRYFKLNGYDFMVELEPPFHQKGRKKNIISNLRPILREFFRKRRVGIFWSPNWYLLIWRDHGIYFVLDFNGRTDTELKTNPDGGYPMLLCLKSADNVVYLIKNLSGLFGSEKFTLREMLVTKLTTPEGKVKEIDYGPRMSQYEVVTSDYAYLKSNLHLTLNPKDALRNRSALPVAIATMLASKVDHPATWDMRMYDKVMCYGVNMCKYCWEPCVDINQPLDLDSFPRQIRLGQFVAEILLTPNAYEGRWRCVPNYKDNDFHFMLEKALNDNDYVLFQINNQMYALWKKTGFIYLMDPYRHHIVGRILEEGEDPKSASIRMFANFDRLLSVFHQMLLESNRSATFHIHTLKLRNLTECPPGTAPELLPPDEDIEVRSLNEVIQFTENYEKCVEELGEISDYEEDVYSIIEPIVELSSSEEMVEEEEGGEAAGEAEVE